MVEWIFPSSTPDPAPPQAVADVVMQLERGERELRLTQSSEGGLARKALRDVALRFLGGAARGSAAGATFAPGELDFFLEAARAAVSVQAGRALNNNGALVGVLAAASAPEVEWVVLVVPAVYKTSPAYAKLVAQAKDLFRAEGIGLDLRGAALVSY